MPSVLLLRLLLIALTACAIAQAQAPPPPAPPSPPPAPAPVPPPAPPSAPLVAIFDTHALGVDPSAAAHVTQELRRTAEALGYSVLAADAARAAVARSQTAGAVSSDRAAEVTRSVAARHGIFASLGSNGRAYVLELQVVPAAGGAPRSARGEAGAADLGRAAEQLLRSVLPPAPAPPPQAATPEPAQAPETAPERSADSRRYGKWRLALQTEGAIGVGGNEFYNHLAGARFDHRFTRRVALGLYVGYANLKGKEGRAHNALSYGLVEYRIPLGSGPLAIPLRYGIGYLPKNGPFMRTSAGLAFSVSDTVDLGLDLVAPTLWVTYDQTVVSMDLAAELALTF